MTNPLRKDDPTRIGPYRLHARLGGGGMGQVFLGHSPGGHTVAVKVVRPELADDPRFRRRFTNEVAAARTVSGFYTAQVVDADPEGDPPWLATAYIPGPSLHQAVTDHGPLPLASVAVLGAGLAEGLAAVHTQKLVHRDLKPANVILAGDGPRLIDFGIARALDTTSHTTTATVLGTPGFMSPEQALAEEVGPASDVFSLGCVLAFAATGHSPFGEGPVHAVVFRIVHEEPDLSGLPTPLADLVSACLAKDPGARPALNRVLDELTASPLSEQNRSEGRWLPEDLTEAINQNRTRLLTLVPTTPAHQPRGTIPPTRHDQAPATGSRLMIGNFGPERLGVNVDGTTLGTVEPSQTQAFPLAPGRHSLSVETYGRPRIVRGVEVKPDATVKMAFDIPDGHGASPRQVQEVKFIGSRMAQAAMASGMWMLIVLVFITTALILVMVTGHAEGTILDVPGVMIFISVFTLGTGVLTYLLWLAVTPDFLTLRHEGLALDGLSDSEVQDGWENVAQVSMIGDGHGAAVLIWPREDSALKEKVIRKDGTIRYSARSIGAVDEQSRERLRAALRWFAGDVYVEQPE